MKDLQMKLEQQVTALNDNLKKVYAELDTNQRLAEVYSNIDHLALFKLDNSKRQLTMVAVDLLDQLDQTERKLADLKEFNKMV